MIQGTDTTFYITLVSNSWSGITPMRDKWKNFLQLILVSTNL